MHGVTRVVFMGSPDFAVPVLRRLAERYEVAGVVTQPDRPAGRGRQLRPPSIKLLAEQIGLPLVQPPKLRQPEAMEQLRAWAPDLIVVAAFGQILRPDVLNLPSQGCINVHASLLPRWRGAAPIQAAILAGDDETGVTIMRMDEGVDTGGILARRALAIQPDETAGLLAERLSQAGAALLMETLPGYLSGELQPQQQDNSAATYSPMLKKEDGLLDPQRPAEELARRVRAFNPRPGTFLQGDGGALKVHRAHAEAGDPAPGVRTIYLGLPAIGTTKGMLVLDEVQPPGKKPMNGRAFLAGARNWGS